MTRERTFFAWSPVTIWGETRKFQKVTIIEGSTDWKNWVPLKFKESDYTHMWNHFTSSIRASIDGMKSGTIKVNWRFFNIPDGSSFSVVGNKVYINWNTDGEIYNWPINIEVNGSVWWNVSSSQWDISVEGKVIGYVNTSQWNIDVLWDVWWDVKSSQWNIEVHGSVSWNAKTSMWDIIIGEK